MLFSVTSLAATLATISALHTVQATPIDSEEPERVGKRCTGTISSLDDVADAIECTTININSCAVCFFFSATDSKTDVSTTWPDSRYLLEKSFLLPPPLVLLSIFASSVVLLAEPDIDRGPTVGDVTFGVANWDGPLFKLSGTTVTFNGNGHTFNGQGASYWVSLGTSWTFDYCLNLFNRMVRA